MNSTSTQNDQKIQKMYSLSAIGLATFLGAPLGGSILIRENYRALNEERKGDVALAFGVLTTIFIFLFIIIIPNHIIDFIPSQLIPAIYTGLTSLWVHYYQGDKLNEYEQSGYKFITKWKAFGLGIISALIIVTFLLGFIYWEANSPVNTEYQRQIDEFIENETATSTFYDNLMVNPNDQLLDELNNKIIPYWYKNRAIIEKLDSLEDITDVLINQNKLLLEYCDLRLEEYTIYRRAIMLNTDIYTDAIDSIHLLIDEKIIELD